MEGMMDFHNLEYIQRCQKILQGKDYFKLDKDEGGILVVKILYGSPFEKVLKKYDIITAIDGHKIENDGTVKFRENQYTHFKYYIDKHQFGDEVSLEVYRDGKKLNLKVKFPKKSTEQNFTLTKFEYDKMPTYYMIGGYVFVPLTETCYLALEDLIYL